MGYGFFFKILRSNILDRFVCIPSSEVAIALSVRQSATLTNQNLEKGVGH